MISKKNALSNALMLLGPSSTTDTDNDGQIIIYTGMYVWSDKRLRPYPEPDDVTEKDNGTQEKNTNRK